MRNLLNQILSLRHIHPVASTGGGASNAEATTPTRLPGGDVARGSSIVESLLSGPNAAGNEYLPESAIDRAFVAELLTRAFVQVDFDSDGDLWVREMGAPRVLVVIDNDRQAIRFVAFYGLREEAEEIAKLALANRANNAVVMVRFRIHSSRTLVADYVQSYAKGLPAWHLVAGLRNFQCIADVAMRENDHDRLLT